jgi:hypothetical protein
MSDTLGFRSFDDLYALGPSLRHALSRIGEHEVTHDTLLMSLLNDDETYGLIANDDKLGSILDWGVNIGWHTPYTLRSSIHQVMSDSELKELMYLDTNIDHLSYSGHAVIRMGSCFGWDGRFGDVALNDPDLLRYVIAVLEVPVFKYLWSWYAYEHDHGYENPESVHHVSPMMIIDMCVWGRSRCNDPGLLMAVCGMLRMMRLMTNDGSNAKGCDIDRVLNVLSDCDDSRMLESALFMVMGDHAYCYQQGMNDDEIIGMWTDDAYWSGFRGNLKRTGTLPLPVLMTNARMGDYHG